jgi:hypothetical protein
MTTKKTKVLFIAFGKTLKGLLTKKIGNNKFTIEAGTKIYHVPASSILAQTSHDN